LKQVEWILDVKGRAELWFLSCSDEATELRMLSVIYALGNRVVPTLELLIVKYALGYGDLLVARLKTSL
jgi:hypothetical protein